MVCGCVMRQLLNFWDFFKGESVVDFIRGDFAVAQLVAGVVRVTWLVPAPPRGLTRRRPSRLTPYQVSRMHPLDKSQART
jgi:hypothetical protein